MSELDNEEPTGSAPQLSAIELRVLGVLMEKQLTTPDQYPLTLNSVITACNQKSSREPITHYTQGEVSRALNELDGKHFVRRERGSRAEKFDQQFMNHLALGRKQQALLCVMMLRGPQSISELNTRTQRMCDFVDREELELCIERLCQREIPYTVRLAQQAGQRGERITHLFGGTPSDSISKHSQALDQSTASGATSEHETHGQISATTSTSQHQDVSDLRATVDELRQETKALRHELQRLYELTGHDDNTDAEN